MKLFVLIFAFSFLFSNLSLFSKPKEKKEVSAQKKIEVNFDNIKLRLLGPAVFGGRISDIAVNPYNKKEFYVGVASGGVWKTTNAGVTFTPIFDSEGSFSIGCLAIDPNNPYVVWVGTGENNSQRSVSWGDGVYKSTDGGKTWKNVGLKKSEHIGKIVIHPRNSNIVYVASQGPLWGPGGDRGLYKTTDGGKNWEAILTISENTGVTDVVMDPRDPDVLYCASYQRRRHVWTLINGGPEAAIYKTTDGGKTWEKLQNGLPSGDLGRIGLGISPANPDYIYAIIEGNENKGGIYRSTDRGASWEKRNSWFSGSAQYYHEVFCDPKNPERVFFIDTYLRLTEDGGKTLKIVSNKNRHVDDHVVWIDPDDTKHWLVGGDGGLYETFDDGQTWRFFANLPTAQFYRIACDNSEPFYFVYGGTQDNNTWGAPSRTTSSGGITNEDWFLVVGGDGYKAQIDPNNPNIVYAMWQYGNLVRYDRKSGEVFYIQPQPEKGEALRWNWDTPMLLSKHSPTRIYICANKVFKSDDRGQSWKIISPDLTRQIDRNKLPVMGKIWGPDAVAKNAATSFYGNITSFAESPLDEKILIVGTDDGLIQITTDGGNVWTKIEKFPTVPETTYVSDVFASNHNKNVIYATFDNHKNADFKPYVLMTTDLGKTWQSISSNLPENGSVYTIIEDYIDPNLLFVGTEFGLFATTNRGKDWIKIKGNFPTIAVRDLEIQRKENDLVVGTFGRGIYILDDITFMRNLNDSTLLEKEAIIFPIKPALIYNEDDSRRKEDQGSSFWRAENPPFGATFTYYLRDEYKTRKQLRKEREKKLEEENKPVYYPSFDSLTAEDLEQKPLLIFKIYDEFGNTVRTLSTSPKKGFNRITWDLRYPDTSPVADTTNVNKASGMAVVPGRYKIQLFKSIDGKISQLTEPIEFECKLLNNLTLPPSDFAKLDMFRKKVSKLQNAIMGTNSLLKEVNSKIISIKNSFLLSLEYKNETLEKIREIQNILDTVNMKLNGNKTLARLNENQPPSIIDRMYYILWGLWATTQEPTEEQKKSFAIAKEELGSILTKLRTIIEKQIPEFEKELDRIGAPWTPGRIPNLEDI
ncbi:MAG: glycosyl hydrolase [Ignavibacteria bacterium]|nr:glycosyl hydrolase [Ignavibacteria bacterium]